MKKEGVVNKGSQPLGGRMGPAAAGRSSSPVDEAPTMRAVSIISGPSVVKDSFARIQKPDQKELGPALMKEAPAGLTVKQDWEKCMAVPSNWVVKTDALEMASFPLERTHREIPGVQAEEVSWRISEALRGLSIEAEFDDEKAKANCRTCDYVCFRIRLFAGSESGQPVVVELQRRGGSGMSFMQSCHAILSAAEGRAPISSHKKSPPFIKCPVAGMKCLKGLKPEIAREAELSIALNKVMELLLRKDDSSAMLALENLCLLTDPLKTHPLMTMRASMTIFTSDSIYYLREEITSLLERDGVARGFGGQNHADRLRHLALLVLSNALSQTAKDGSLERSIQQEEWFEDFLIPTLMDEVRRAKTSPNNAYVACGCLFSLISCSVVARGLTRESNGVLVLSEAHEHGAVCHELLANETERCMKALGASHLS